MAWVLFVCPRQFSKAPDRPLRKGNIKQAMHQELNVKTVFSTVGSLQGGHFLYRLESI